MLYSLLFMCHDNWDFFGIITKKRKEGKNTPFFLTLRALLLKFSVQMLWSLEIRGLARERMAQRRGGP